MTTRAKVAIALLPMVEERGYAGLTYEGLAARSGVAKTTLYRHWPTKAEMVFDLVLHDRELPPLSAYASADEAAEILATRIVAFLADDGALSVMAALLADLADNPPLAARFRDSFVMGGERELATFLAPLAETSRPELDVQDVQMTLLGAAQAWLTVAGLPREEVLAKVTDLARLLLTAGP